MQKYELQDRSVGFEHKFVCLHEKKSRSVQGNV